MLSLNAILRDAKARASSDAPTVKREDMIAGIYAEKLSGPIVVHYYLGLPEVYEFHPTIKVKVK